jgi:hypothetical protein
MTQEKRPAPDGALRGGSFDRTALRAIAETAVPEPGGEVVATVYQEGSALYVEPLPPQSLACLKPIGVVGCPVARVYYGFADVTPEQQAAAEWAYRSADLDRNRVLVVGHLAMVTVRDHRTHETTQQTWFMVGKLYLPPSRGRFIESHSTQFFYVTGTTSQAQAVAITRGEPTPRPARITWTGPAASGAGGPTSVDDMFVTGQADFTRSPLPISADEYFVRQMR